VRPWVFVTPGHVLGNHKSNFKLRRPNHFHQPAVMSNGSVSPAGFGFGFGTAWHAVTSKCECFVNDALPMPGVPLPGDVGASSEDSASHVGRLGTVAIASARWSSLIKALSLFILWKSMLSVMHELQSVIVPNNRNRLQSRSRTVDSVITTQTPPPPPLDAR
jgi:hypothetical protein